MIIHININNAYYCYDYTYNSFLIVFNNNNYSSINISSHKGKCKSVNLSINRFLQLQV